MAARADTCIPGSPSRGRSCGWRPASQPFFVGARRGIERDVLPHDGFEHLLLDLHPLYRRRPWKNWRTVRGLGSAWRALGASTGRSRPALVVGTGGYACGAALAFAAHAMECRSCCRSRTRYPGITTRFFARWARAMLPRIPGGEGAAASRTATRSVFDTGNPIEPPPIAAARDADGAARVGISRQRRTGAARVRRQPGRARAQ